MCISSSAVELLPGLKREDCIGDTDIPACKEVSIEITEKCLANCIHCSSEATKDGWKNELTLEEIKEIMSVSKERLGTKVISLSGGEPLLKDSFSDILEYIKELGLNVLIYTCGIYDTRYSYDTNNYHWNPYFSDERAFENCIGRGLSGKGDKIIFSIEGVDSLTHDYTTGIVGSFVNEWAYIDYLVKRGYFVEIHCCPTILNYDELGDLVKMAEEHGVGRVSFLRLVPQGRCKDKRWLLVKGNKWLKLQEDLVRLYHKYGDFIRVGDPLNFMWYFDNNIKNTTCSAGLDRILIRANGETQFCAALKHAPDYDYGNVREEGWTIGDRLEWLWKESPMVLKLRSFHEKNYKFIQGCGSCEYLEICKGGCLSQRIAHYGDMFRGPDPLCVKTLEGGTLTGECGRCGI